MRALLWLAFLWAIPLHAAELSFEIRDSAGKLLPCRIHLLTETSQPVKTPGQVSYRDHFVCPGTAKLDLPAGKYRYEIERGPEHERLKADFELTSQPTTIKTTLRRIADLSTQGWHAGDLHVHRKLEDIPLLLQAEDLQVAQVITWWNKTNLWKSGLPQDSLRSVHGQAWYHILAGEDERGGGALLYFHLPKPLEITQAQREYPAAATFLQQAKSSTPDCWVDLEKPFWWEAPIWIATGHVDSIGLANNHMCRSQMYPSEAWGKPRDTTRLPPPLGNGYYTQEVYYHLLNAGLRIPPSAGSASGVLPNPVGYNRVYVHSEKANSQKAHGKKNHSGERFDYGEWWSQLRNGRSFVTNGPLLLVSAAGQDPGHVFSMNSPKELKLDITLLSLDRIPSIEIIHNGTVLQRLPCTADREQHLTAKLSLSNPGWFLVRAITDNPQTFRFASTAPFYVEFPNQPPHISRTAVQFFRDWTTERASQIPKLIPDESKRREVLAPIEAATKFWDAKLQAAHAP